MSQWSQSVQNEFDVNEVVEDISMSDIWEPVIADHLHEKNSSPDGKSFLRKSFNDLVDLIDDDWKLRWRASSPKEILERNLFKYIQQLFEKVVRLDSIDCDCRFQEIADMFEFVKKMKKQVIDQQAK